MTERWLQRNVALVRRDGRALESARAVFARLAPLVAAARKDRTLRAFFFMRKPPDLRLRFGLTRSAPGFGRAIDVALRSLERGGAIRRSFPSVYEPEIRQFGGIEAMERVHRWFDADTTLWLALDRLAGRGEEIEWDRVSEALINDLFLRTLEDAAEVWDAWSNLAELVPPGEGEVAAREPLFFDAPISRPIDAITARAARANAALGRGLQALWGRGRLGAGLRAILPFVAWFHWNRFGITPERQTRLARTMAAAWNPKRGLRGA